MKLLLVVTVPSVDSAGAVIAKLETTTDGVGATAATLNVLSVSDVYPVAVADNVTAAEAETEDGAVIVQANSTSVTYSMRNSSSTSISRWESRSSKQTQSQN